MAALIAVESHINPTAVGTHSELGILQIKFGTLMDIDRIMHRQVYHPDDRLDLEKSKEMCCIYLSHYTRGTVYPNVAAMYEDMARTWKGGPHGKHLDETTEYWHKVEAELLKTEITVPS